MIGYTRKQLEDELNNKLIKLIFKDDRTELINSINKQLKLSDTFASEQRVEKGWYYYMDFIKRKKDNL